MKFKSKVGWWFYLLTALFIALPLFFIYLGITNDTFYFFLATVFALITAFLILPIYFNTNYTFTVETLNIRSGLGQGLKIPYENIISFKETHNPLASAALSLDRIEISYKDNVVLVSPRNKADFIRLLSEHIR